jgi:hypothetical protein
MAEEPQGAMPPSPFGMARSKLGGRVMAWGTGNDAALAWIQTVLAEWLTQHGVTAPSTTATLYPRMS